MQRREFITLFGGMAIGWPVAARAQQPAGRAYRIGFLSIGSRERTLYAIKAFEEGLRSLGYTVGENVAIEYRFADGEMERLPALAADLVLLDVDIILTGYNPITVAAMKATTTIPIVMTVGIDPVRDRLVGSTGSGTSRSRPGNSCSLLLKRLRKACGASAIALARMSTSSTASPTARWNGCPGLPRTWSGSAWTSSSSPGSIRWRLQ